MKKQILTTLFTLIVISSFAQERGKLSLVIAPADALIRIDGQVISADSLKIYQQRYINEQEKTPIRRVETTNGGHTKANVLGILMDLPIGKHKIEAWQEIREHYQTAVNVVANQTTKIEYGLKPSEEFKAHQEQVQKYRKEQINAKTLPMGLIAGSVLLGTTAAIWNPWAKEKKELTALKDIYNTAINVNSIEKLKEDYTTRKEAYNKKQHIRTGIIALSAATGIISTYFLIKNKKNKKPVFEPKNPFSLDYQPNFNGHYVWIPKTSFTINF